MPTPPERSRWLHLRTSPNPANTDPHVPEMKDSTKRALLLWAGLDTAADHRPVTCIGHSGDCD